MLLVKFSLHSRPNPPEVIKRLSLLRLLSSMCMLGADISVTSLLGNGTEPMCLEGRRHLVLPQGPGLGSRITQRWGGASRGDSPQDGSLGWAGGPCQWHSPSPGTCPHPCGEHWFGAVFESFWRCWLHTVSRYHDFACSKSELSHLGAGTKGNYLVSTSVYNAFIKCLHFKCGWI